MLMGIWTVDISQEPQVSSASPPGQCQEKGIRNLGGLEKVGRRAGYVQVNEGRNLGDIFSWISNGGVASKTCSRYNGGMPIHLYAGDFDEGVPLVGDALRLHATLYYVFDAPEITGTGIRRIVSSRSRREARHPDWVTPESPTQKVGGKVRDGLATVTHVRPMLSLATKTDSGDAHEFDTTVQKP